MNNYKIKMIDKESGEVFYVELKALFALHACRKACEDFPDAFVESFSKVK